MGPEASRRSEDYVHARATAFFGPSCCVRVLAQPYTCTHAILRSYLCSLLTLSIRKTSPAAATPAATTAKLRERQRLTSCSTHLLSSGYRAAVRTHSCDCVGAEAGIEPTAANTCVAPSITTHRSHAAAKMAAVRAHRCIAATDTRGAASIIVARRAPCCKFFTETALAAARRQCRGGARICARGCVRRRHHGGGVGRLLRTSAPRVRSRVDHSLDPVGQVRSPRRARLRLRGTGAVCGGTVLSIASLKCVLLVLRQRSIPFASARPRPLGNASSPLTLARRVGAMKTAREQWSYPRMGVGTDQTRGIEQKLRLCRGGAKATTVCRRNK